MEKLLFTSESVTEGHPDKVCDAISDAILDALMEQDPMSRVACETATCTGFVLVTGEITTKAYVDIPKIVRDTVKEIGYNKSEYGFDGNTCAVFTAIDEQSGDIAMGVDKALEAKENKMSDAEIEAIGAGDQGMMFGYATNETEEYMPYPISLAHKLALQLTKVRKDGTLNYLRPDGKTQVSVEYDENGKPKRLEAVVLSTQHDEDVTQEQIHQDIRKHVFDVILPKELIDADTKFFINPTGRFVIGGPHGDAGLTGRKIIVLMADMRAMAAGLFPERTAQRWTEAVRMRQDMSQRIWLPQVLRTSARFSFHTRLVWHSLHQSTWIPLEQAGLTARNWLKSFVKTLTFVRQASFGCLTLEDRFISRQQHMVTSAATTLTCLGKNWIRLMY